MTTKLYVVKWLVDMRGIKEDVVAVGITKVRAVDEDTALQAVEVEVMQDYPEWMGCEFVAGSVEISKNDPVWYSRSLL